MLSSAIVLGPQRHVRLVREALQTLVPSGRAPVAAVTAGWEEREAEVDELREHVGRPVHNLAVWARVERVFERDPELFAAMRARHDMLRRSQELYRLRLAGLMEATLELFRRHNDDAMLVAEQDDAVAMVQQLDEQHVRRVREVHREFEARWQPHERPAVQSERRELERLLADCACLLVAGGHVAVLLHRLRLFDVFGLFGDRPVIAWSAGAMALSERVVLFHHSPPQGSAHAEVMEAGLGLLPRLVAQPHAKHRLAIDDERAPVFARRFAPAICVLLDTGSCLQWNGRRWSAASGTRRLVEDGWVEEVGA